MKNIVIVFAMLIVTITMDAQPCKYLSQGMTKANAIKLVGKPTEIVFLGTDNVSGDSLVAWNYGNQQVTFFGNKISRIISDYKKEEEVIKKFENHEISQNELVKELDIIHSKACR
jgi:hypothetical protein